MHESISVLVAVAISAIGCSHLMPSRSHGDADASRTRTTEAGAFVVSYGLGGSEVPKRQLGSWTVVEGGRHD